MSCAPPTYPVLRPSSVPRGSVPNGPVPSSTAPPLGAHIIQRPHSIRSHTVPVYIVRFGIPSQTVTSCTAPSASRARHALAQDALCRRQAADINHGGRRLFPADAAGEQGRRERAEQRRLDATPRGCPARPARVCAPASRRW
eukprot:1650535-Rhodomonas_salina.1